eukprot:CAMPEP_0197027668 /NCGR_PEP_ID=MMETSP1384-20130603/7537_1 /TAXON_ID=29189 /ORGANISM="Ammonia sp." /LENGTH=381 /DNA_ID=CAMNT_0042456545 /DNA_START=19 /DNA_END=1161 /DNA_ORIENTATION=+
MLLLSALLWTATTAFVEVGQYQCPRAVHLPYKISATDGVRVNLTDAQNNDGAACLDGSVPVMYWRAGTGDGVNKFQVFFQGGGWCGGIDEEVSKCQDTCVHRSGTGLGSSLSYGAALDYDNSYMSTSSAENPLSYNWNTVYVPYCDGASFSGNNDTAQVYNSTLTLHWKGFRILNGVFKELNANYGWSKATDVLISGCSAGGLTTWLHSQHIWTTYVKPLGIATNHFLAMPDSGFFLEWQGAGKYVSAMQWLYEWQNTSGAVNQQCIAANKENAWKCMFAQETGPYEGIRMFPLQSRFDSWQSDCEAGSKDNATMNEYGANLTTNFMDMYINAGGAYASLHSGFLDSCFHHCGVWNAFDIDGLNASTAQYQVYYGQNKQKW